MSDLNKSIRSTEHKVAVEVLNIIVSKANEYADTIAKEQNEKSLVSKIKKGEPANKADVEKLLPVTGGVFSSGNAGNLDLLEVLFLQSIFSENKINADNVKTIADVIKGTSDTKKSIEKYLLEYFLAPLESVWAADQYQNDKFNGLSDATNKVFGIIYTDFLSTPDAITAIDFSSANFQAKKINKDGFNLIIKRCLKIDVDTKVTKQLIDKGIDLIAPSKTLVSDLHSHVKFAFYQKINAAYINLDKSANDSADYSKMAVDSVKLNSELDEAVKLIENKGGAIGLKFDDIDAFIGQSYARANEYIGDTVKEESTSKPETKPEEPKSKPEEPKSKPEESKPKPEEPKPKPEEPKSKPEESKPKPDDVKPKTNQISEKFITQVITQFKADTAKSDDLNFGKVQVKNILKSLGENVLNAETAKNYVKNLMKYKSGSLGADAFKPIGEYQNSVKDALYTCANYLKNGKHLNNCFARLNDQKLIDGVKQEAKSDVCYFKQFESGNGQYSNLHITFAGEGHPNYRVEKTANPTGGCIEIKDNDPLELLAIAVELTAE